jgi:DNA-binding response OmpR family regulator
VSRQSLLFLRDFPGLEYLLRALLEPEGYALVVAESEREALRRLEGRRPALIILDWPMEDEGPTAFLRELCRRGLRPGIPVLVLTGEGWRIGGLLAELGVEGWLAKPFHIAELLGEVARLVGRDRSFAGGSRIGATVDRRGEACRGE